MKDEDELLMKSIELLSENSRGVLGAFFGFGGEDAPRRIPVSKAQTSAEVRLGNLIGPGETANAMSLPWSKMSKLEKAGKEALSKVAKAAVDYATAPNPQDGIRRSNPAGLFKFASFFSPSGGDSKDDPVSANAGKESSAKQEGSEQEKIYKELKNDSLFKRFKGELRAGFVDAPDIDKNPGKVKEQGGKDGLMSDSEFELAIELVMRSVDEQQKNKLISRNLKVSKNERMTILGNILIDLEEEWKNNLLGEKKGTQEFADAERALSALRKANRRLALRWPEFYAEFIKKGGKK